MKKLAIICIVLMHSQFTISQNFVGKWYGTLKVQGVELALVFNISKTETGYKSTMDSPAQGAKDIPITQTTVSNSTIKLEIPAGKISYSGELKNEVIEGVFTQNGQTFPMNLTQNQSANKTFKRPQEPKEPFSYYTEDIKFENKSAKIFLAGTLTLPKKEGVYPAVILISGSGPQNRNEEILGHKPFLVLADYLTKKGFAVLRYDDRGVGKSEGDFSKATSAEFATDVESSLTYLKTRKEINTKKIGLIGHSEGGLIAPMVASKNKDIAFIVLLAGPGLKGDKLLLLQKEKIERAMGTPESEILQGQKVFSELYKMMAEKKEGSQLKNYLTNQKDLPLKEGDINAVVNQLNSNWMRYYINYDPAMALSKTKCALLAINGENDLQVAFRENLDTIKNASSKAKNNNTTFKSYPKLNHLFQNSVSGSPSEYQTIEETFSPMVLQDVADWMLLQTK